MDLTTKTTTELNAMTKDQIITALVEDRTTTQKTKLVEGVHGMVENEHTTYDYLNNKIGSVSTTWTYWDNGNVKDITITRKDANGKVIGTPQVISHKESGGLDLSIQAVSKEVL